MATVPALTERTEAQRWLEVRDDDGLWGDLRPELREAVRVILETTMEDELAAELVAARYERTPWRTDTRNGAYHRTLVTELGAIIDLRVPRRRLVPYRPSFLVSAARRTTTVDRVLRQAFLRGLSTRETAALAETLTGVTLSAAAISRLTRQLDDQVAAFHRRPITFAARYLLVDGLWVSVRASARAKRRVVLAAYGIDETGRRELLDYRQAASESSAEWTRFLSSLVARGPRPRIGPTGHRRRGRWDRGRGGRGLPAGRPAALLDASHPEPARGHPAGRATGVPGRAAGHLSGPHATSRGRRLLALGDALASPPSDPGPPPRGRSRRPARGVGPARADPAQPAHDEPHRACLPRAPPAAPTDRCAARPALRRPDPV